MVFSMLCSIDMSDRYIYLKIDRKQAEILARIFSLIEVNLKINPMLYGQKAFSVTPIYQQLDYLIHEVAHWCDKSDCHYWKKKSLKTQSTKN